MSVKINSIVKKFKVSATNGLEINSDELRGKNLVLYFYPKDNTPGCTLETRDFSMLYKKFKALKYEVVGISKDNMESHLKFKKKFKVPFQLLSDEKIQVQKKYGIWGPKSFMGKKFMGTIRSTIVINKGKIIKVWSNVRVKDHAKEVLNFIKSSK
mgnify:CR=1 FL=1